MAPAIAITFLTSLRSVGTAMTMATVGVYLHQRGYIQKEGKRTLALISQQVTFPLFLFTKIIYCDQDWSSNPCPDIVSSLKHDWMLLLWPIFVVGSGLLVGALVAKLVDTPKHQRNTVLVACGFGNSSGLAITLLSALHANSPASSDLGRVDPTIFLSIYLLLYPVLQWGIGGWLLAPSHHETDLCAATKPLNHHHNNHSSSSSSSYGPTTAAEDLDTQNIEVSDAPPHHVFNNRRRTIRSSQVSSNGDERFCSPTDLSEASERGQAPLNGFVRSEGIHSPPSNNGFEIEGFEIDDGSDEGLLHDELPLLPSSLAERPFSSNCAVDDRIVSPWQTVQSILYHGFQPPVIGAIAGILCAVTPLRGIFVDLVDRDGDTPLEWFFDGLYAIGATAIPINMLLLGCNLSSSIQMQQQPQSVPPSELLDRSNAGLLLSRSTMVGIMVGKLIVLPVIGIMSAWILKNYLLNIPDDTKVAFYLVLMIVFLTPTANNVMVMVELSGAGEGFARVIALQYAVAPVILSLTLSLAIGVASG